MRVLRSDQKAVMKLKDLDRLDRQLLYTISKNSRIPSSKIAHILHTPRDNIKYRIKRFETLDILVGSRMVANIRKLGYSSFHIFAELKSHKKEQEDEFVAQLNQDPFINAIISYSGKRDLEISVMAKDVFHFNDILRNKILASGFIDNFEILILVNTIKGAVIPDGMIKENIKIDYDRNDCSFYKDFMFKNTKKSNGKNGYKLDKTDIKLLSLLSENANLSLTKLGEKTDLSKDAVGYRIRNLIDSDIIVGFKPAVNYSNLGLSIQAFLLKLESADEKLKHDIDLFIKNHPNVLWAVDTLGRWDILMYLVTQSQDEIHNTVEDFRKSFGNNIKNYEILFAYQEHKYSYFPEGISQELMKEVQK